MGSLFGGSAPKPDPTIAEVAHNNIAIGKDWLNFADQAYADNEGRIRGIDQTANQEGGQQLDLSSSAANNYSQIMDRYQHLFQPLEDRTVSDANNWDSAANQEAAAAKAKADVLNTQAANDAATERQMAAYGISPASGRYQGMQRANDLNAGIAAVGAENSARDNLRREGVTLRQQAAQYGLGTTGVAANNANLSTAAGHEALGAGLNSFNAALQNYGIKTSAYGGAMSGNNSGAGILNGQYQNSLGAYNQQQQSNAATASSLAMAAAYAYSSKELKEDKKPVDGALQAIKGLPVESWRYKDGVSDGGTVRHIGPYAEDIAKVGIGDGTKIPLQDAIGLTMKAVQELDGKVDKIAKQKAA